MATQSNSYDVVIIGGGPSGSTTATLLAQKGYRVLVLEKTRFPRFSVGESLLPECYWPLKRIGMLQKMKDSHFQKKYSIQFVSHSGRKSRPFYFFETNKHESSQTWQVKRAEFDLMMLENAMEHGAEVRQETLVKDIIMEGDQVVGVRVASTNNGSTEEEIRAKVVVDASGRNSFLGRRFQNRIPDPKLRKMAYFAHFENVVRDTGIDEGVTIVYYIRENKGWFWFIPLHDNTVSIGVVSAPEILQEGRSNDPVKVLEEEIDLAPALKERLVNARRTTDVHVLSDYSHKNKAPAGNGWVTVGDSFGFLDPIYSSGVLLGMKTAEMVTDAIDEAFKAGDFSAERLSSFAPAAAKGLENFRKLVYAFYTPGFHFGKFAKDHPECRQWLIDMLSGDVFKDEVDALFPILEEYLNDPEKMPERESAEMTGNVMQ